LKKPTPEEEILSRLKDVWPEPKASFSKGDDIEANSKGSYLPGKISFVHHDCTYDVKYANGDLDQQVDIECIRSPGIQDFMYTPFQVEILQQLLERVQKRFEFRFDLAAFVMLFGSYLAFPIAVIFDFIINRSSWDFKEYGFICSNFRSCIGWCLLYGCLVITSLMFFNDSRQCVGPFTKMNEYFQCHQHDETTQPCSASRAEVFFPVLLYFVSAFSEALIASSFARTSIISTKHQTHNVMAYLRWKTQASPTTPVEIKNHKFTGEDPEDVQSRNGSMRHIGQDSVRGGFRSNTHWGAVFAGVTVSLCFGAAVGAAVGSLVSGRSKGGVVGASIGTAAGFLLAAIVALCCENEFRRSYAGVQLVLKGYWRKQDDDEILRESLAAEQQRRVDARETGEDTLNQMFNGNASLYDVASIVLGKNPEEDHSYNPVVDGVAKWASRFGKDVTKAEASKILEKTAFPMVAATMLCFLPRVYYWAFKLVTHHPHIWPAKTTGDYILETLTSVATFVLGSHSHICCAISSR
jgi:hypothetical protein